MSATIVEKNTVALLEGDRLKIADARIDDIRHDRRFWCERAVDQFADLQHRRCEAVDEQIKCARTALGSDFDQIPTGFRQRRVGDDLAGAGFSVAADDFRVAIEDTDDRQ